MFWGIHRQPAFKQKALISYRHLNILTVPLYYYFLLLTGLAIIIIVTIVLRSLVFPKNNISVDLFNEALRNENNGLYEEALANYESALIEVNKTRFHSNFKNKIIEKLKVLHTLIEYNNGVRIMRK